ncbi:MAG: hypothetical protein JXP37_06220 [Coriobacteriia bacterium]|nr:hypothetical protein [Coriobacteriia bacterium]
MDGRRKALIVGLAVIAVIITAAVLLNTPSPADLAPDPATTDGSGSTPAAVLDAALAEGRPAYVLVRSLT